jgi:putative ABC transport system substrate-binding protein
LLQSWQFVLVQGLHHEADMKRLHVAIVGVVSALVLSCGVVSAQEAGRVYRIGWLAVGSPGYVSPPIEKWAYASAAPFRDSLRDAGYVAGRNLVVDRRHANGDIAQLPTVAEALTGSGVDALVGEGTPPTIALMQATRSIPIIFLGVGFPVEMGIVASLAAPGGNVTGTAIAVARQTQWRLLREVAPTVRRAGYLASAANRPADEQYAPYRASMLETVKAEAAAAGIEPIRMGIFGFSDIEPLLIELARRGDAGVVLSGDLILLDRQWLPSIVDMAVRLRLPTSCTGDREWAKWGCLVTYAEDWGVHSVAIQLAKVLNGTRPADIPVAQSTGQRLIVNSKTAKALNLTIPPAMLARADEVIE